MAEEKAWRKQRKNAASNIEQVLEATPYKVVLYSHVPYHNDTIIKTHAGITDAVIKTQEDFFN